MDAGSHSFGAGVPVVLHGRQNVLTFAPRLWPESTVVCIGCGPSLTQSDVELVHNAHAAGCIYVIAINAAIRLAPWADLRYAYHAVDWDRPEDRELLANFKGLRFGVEGETASTALR